MITRWKHDLSITQVISSAVIAAWSGYRDFGFLLEAIISRSGVDG
jgi:hypothetical protein